MEKAVCGAKTRKGTPCQRKPLSNGRCNSHGGKSTGPKDKEKHRQSLKGNKNAVTTHQYETLWADQFTGKHRDLFQLAPTDALEIVDMEIRKNEVRQMLIHDDIAELKLSGDKRKVDAITKKEDALTSVQNLKIRLLETKLKLIAMDKEDTGEDDSSLLTFVSVLEGMRKERKEIKAKNNA